MHRRVFLRRYRFILGAMLVAAASPMCLGQATTQPAQDNVARVLELADPEIVDLKKLDPSTVDLDKVDIKTKTAAIMALNNFLAKHGERARKRVALLEDYIASRGLSEDFTQDSGVVPDASMPTLEEGLKLAVLVVQMPEGKAATEAQFRDSKPEMLNRIYSSYYAMCRKDWGEVAYRRYRVQELASYLDRRDLLNDFVTWAKDEMARQKQVQAEVNAQIIADRKAEEERLRAARIQRKREAEDRQWEKTLRRLEYAERRDRDDYYYRD